MTSPLHTIKGRLGLSLFPVVALAAVVAGCGSSASTNPPSGSSKPQAAASNVAATPSATTANFAMQVLTSKLAAKDGYLGPDGNGHDTFMLANLSAAAAHDPQTRSTLTVKAGEKVTITVTNYDEGPHTFTVPDLGINATIKPAINADKGIPSKTTFTFLATKSGKFRWYCSMPCDDKHGSWAMSSQGGDADQVGYMAGYVVVG